jgi:hypothetical protein
MDPMSYAFIFCVGWVVSHAFGEKRDEYSASQEAHRDKYLAKLDRNHPSWGRARREKYLRNAAGRNTLGHFAYLLRHGWSSTFNDFGEGWKRAKEAHEEWRAENPKGRPGRWRTFKAGWKDRWSRRPKADEAKAAPEPTPSPEPPPTPEPADDAPKATKSWLNEDEARSAQILPWPNTPAPGDKAGSTNGEPVNNTMTSTTGEAHNLDDVRRNSAAFVIDVTKVLFAADQLLADTMRFASKDRESIALLQQNIEGLNNVIAGFSKMPASLSKHAPGEEYASQQHSVDNIDALRSS